MKESLFSILSQGAEEIYDACDDFNRRRETSLDSIDGYSST